jgi:choice-of-anchor A domain-containing protein
MNLTRIVCALAAPVVFSLAAARGAIYTVSDAFQSSAFVRDNAKVGDHGASGAVIIGGNLTTGNNHFDVILKSVANAVQGNGLAVGGTIFLPSSPNGGLVQVSGADGKPLTSYGSAQMNGKTLSEADGVKYIQSSGGLAAGGETSVTQAFANLELLSERIAKLAAAQGTAITLEPNDGSKFVLSGSASVIRDSSIMKEGFRIYNLDASLLQGNNPLTASSLGITSLGKSDLIVINIVNAGKYDSNTLRLQLADEWADHVLWNVDGAANLKTGPSNFNGTLLAPESSFTNQDRVFNGSMIVRGYDGTKAGDLNPVQFGGTLGGDSRGLEGSPSATPEPTSALVGVLLALGLLRRNRN